MNANNPVLGSDLARVDAHVIQPDEYNEIPDIAEADLARGTWKIAGKVVSPAVGKAAFAAAMRKQKINLTIDSDVLAFPKQQAGGRGYQTLIDAALREAMRTKPIEEALRKVIREELHIA